MRTQDKKRKQKMYKGPSRRLHESRMVDVDSANSSIRYNISPSTPDRHRTIFIPSGWDTRNFESNPICLWNHRIHGNPDDAIATVSNLERNSRGLFGTINFHRRTEMSEQVWDLASNNIIRGVSHHFGVSRVIVPESRAEDIDDLDPVSRAHLLEGRVDAVFNGQDLREVSKVLLGSNPEGLQDLSRAFKEGKVEESFLRRVLSCEEFDIVSSEKKEEEVMDKNTRAVIEIFTEKMEQVCDKLDSISSRSLETVELEAVLEETEDPNTKRITELEETVRSLTEEVEFNQEALARVMGIEDEEEESEEPNSEDN